MGTGNKSGCDHHPPGRDTGSLPCPCLSPGQHLPLSQGWKSFYCPTPKSSCMAFEEPLGRDEAPVPPSTTLNPRCHCWDAGEGVSAGVGALGKGSRLSGGESWGGVIH